MRRFGLIGKSLSHSFSKKYFSEKFKRENLTECQYDLFELSSIELIQTLFDIPEIEGLNITIPYKKEVIPFLDDLDHSATKVGAVNVIKFQGSRRIGYNSDYYGFFNSLKFWLNGFQPSNAIILGTGGASLAVKAALTDMDIPFKLVSRTPGPGQLSYEDFAGNMLSEIPLIINTTPVGTFPDITLAPKLPYHLLSAKHFLYDLVYNPEVTAFMQHGVKQGANVKNGLEMLELQALESWKIWNTN